MSCEHLICAQCAGPVAEGRCSVCRVTRDHVHQGGHGLSLPMVLAAALVLLLLSLAAMHLGH
jgi:hypothetical protein